jgi:hypothetical protein
LDRLNFQRLDKFLLRAVIVTSYSSSERFEANQARPKMGVLAYNLLHMIRQFYFWGDLIKEGARFFTMPGGVMCT